MRELAAISAVYAAIDRMFSKELERARSDHNEPRKRQLEAQRRINDQAYFVLCWGQLEAEVDATCREAIRIRQAYPDWERRRGWDIYNPDDPRLSGLSIEERTALVTDRGAGKGSAYAEIMRYYALRNQIAHGRTLATVVDIPEVIQAFYIVQSQLKK